MSKERLLKDWVALGMWPRTSSFNPLSLSFPNGRERSRWLLLSAAIMATGTAEALKVRYFLEKSNIPSKAKDAIFTSWDKGNSLFSHWSCYHHDIPPSKTSTSSTYLAPNPTPRPGLAPEKDQNSPELSRGVVAASRRLPDTEVQMAKKN